MAVQSHPSHDRAFVLTARTVIGFLVYSLLTPVILFLAAGTLYWPEAWVYAAISIVAAVASRVLILVKQPDLAAERGRFTEGEGAKAWDRRLVPIVALLLPALILVVCGLDYRWQASGPVAASLQWTAGILLIAGYAFSLWALITNRFFSTVVRIQRERGHTVVSSGPYRFVRHPGYAGGLLYYITTPLMLGTLWGLLPVLVEIVLLVLRTALEDRTLQAELPGYAGYARRVRYRLVPGVW
jgi:protein-S-isoprenylcysteine O-methyltransferase Ste14